VGRLVEQVQRRQRAAGDVGNRALALLLAPRRFRTSTSAGSMRIGSAEFLDAFLRLSTTASRFCATSRPTRRSCQRW
jgi:hypothetical protein